MSDLVREAPFGQIVRWATRNRYFRYPEEEAGFRIPWESSPLVSSKADEIAAEKIEGRALDTTDGPESRQAEEAVLSDVETPLSIYKEISLPPGTLSRAATERDVESILEARATRTRSREETTPWSENRFEIEQAEAVYRTQSEILVPTKTNEGITLVGWYTTDDPANPQNWSSKKKAYVTFLILYVSLMH